MLEHLCPTGLLPVGQCKLIISNALT